MFRPNQHTFLLNRLKARIDYYLENDLHFWCGAEGKKRAEDYRTEISKPIYAAVANDQPSDSRLLFHVLADITAPYKEGVLGSSETLRQRLAEAICEHLGLSQNRFTAEINQMVGTLMVASRGHANKEVITNAKISHIRQKVIQLLNAKNDAIDEENEKLEPNKAKPKYDLQVLQPTDENEIELSARGNRR